jgi:predicted transcriptional regulator
VNVAVLRRTTTTSKQYDLEMDHFIVKALHKKNIGYRDLFRLVKEKYKQNISYDTFDRHVKHLTNSGMINKDQKYPPFYLTEKCKRQLKLKVLTLVPPKMDGSSFSTRLATASKRINTYILLLLFKSGSTYEFEKIEELEYFLSIFGLSVHSFTFKTGRYISLKMRFIGSRGAEFLLTREDTYLLPIE